MPTRPLKTFLPYYKMIWCPECEYEVLAVMCDIFKGSVVWYLNCNHRVSFMRQHGGKFEDHAFNYKKQMLLDGVDLF